MYYLRHTVSIFETFFFQACNLDLKPLHFFAMHVSPELKNVSSALIGCSIISRCMTRSRTGFGVWCERFLKLISTFYSTFNRANEIHLDTTTRQHIYDMYYAEMSSIEEVETVSYPTFLKIWYKIFPNVKIPARKAVHGKCLLCSTLTELLRGHCTIGKHYFIDFIIFSLKTNQLLYIFADERKYYRAMFSFHAATFMSERRQYYARRTEAFNYPDSFCSMIMDGMAQVFNYF
jgi:hypothetical protein